LKVTGGGQINVTTGGVASFGFNARQIDVCAGTGTCGATADGHFNYVNHDTGLHVNGPVTNMRVNSPTSATFCGTCGPGSNVSSCSFIVTVEDKGEPGRNDTFTIQVTGSMPDSQSGMPIARGNIQIHKP
jgi:hypothetical protein